MILYKSGVVLFRNKTPTNNSITTVSTIKNDGSLILDKDDELLSIYSGIIKL